VLGHVLAPLNTSDFSSQLLAAQASGAQVVGLANSGADTANSVKQAFEFGLGGKQTLAAFLPFTTDIRAIGLPVAQGLILTTAFYWDRSPETRAWSQRFYAQRHAMPTMIQAGTYSATLQYLKAVKAAGTKDSDAVAKQLKELPVDDAFAQGKVLANGRFVHDMYLFEVKRPSDSKKPWDYYKLLATVPGDKAYFSAAESGCPLTK